MLDGERENMFGRERFSVGSMEVFIAMEFGEPWEDLSDSNLDKILLGGGWLKLSFVVVWFESWSFSDLRELLPLSIDWAFNNWNSMAGESIGVSIGDGALVRFTWVSEVAWSWDLEDRALKSLLLPEEGVMGLEVHSEQPSIGSIGSRKCWSCRCFEGYLCCCWWRRWWWGGRRWQCPCDASE